MSFNLIPASEIEKFRLNEQIIRDTASQVIKDFALFGFDIRFPEGIHYVYSSLYNQLQPVISMLLETQPERLSALLYQIDLDEKKIQPLQNSVNNPEVITELILEREFLKVLTRYYFKSKAQ